MTSRNGGTATRPSPPSLRQVRPLRPDEREALKASIRHFGIVMPIVVDQHGTMIDGFNRSEIAAELGITMPTPVTRICKDDYERDALKLQLNSNRRQMSEEEWKKSLELADHLLSEGGHSDRAIAAAVGVGKDTVRRRRRKSGGGASAPSPGTKGSVKGQDGKSYPAAGKNSAIEERILQLLGAVYPDVLTASDMNKDPELAATPGWNRKLTDLKRKGLIEQVGGRGSGYRIILQPESPGDPGPTQKKSPLRAKAEKTLDELTDNADLRKEIQQLLKELRDERKYTSQMEKIFKSAEQEQIFRVMREYDRASQRSQELYLQNKPWEGLVVRLKAECKLLGEGIVLLNDAKLPRGWAVQELDRVLDDL